MVWQERAVAVAAFVFNINFSALWPSLKNKYIDLAIINRKSILTKALDD